MEKNRPSRLRFNFGFFLEAPLGTSRQIELDYPTIEVTSDLTLTPLQGSFTAVRTSEGVYVSGDLTTLLPITCMRCLEDARVPANLRLDDLFYYPPTSAPADEYVIGEDGFVDLAPLVRELALLELPYLHFCREDCQGLCSHCGQNLNEATCNCQEEVIDPRLAALRDLLDPD
jgi:uncharacterized protein